jgi:hypothetical protein
MNVMYRSPFPPPLFITCIRKQAFFLLRPQLLILA